MKIQKTRKSKKPLLITLAVLLALVGGGVAWAATQQNTEHKNTSPSSKSDKKSTDITKDSTKSNSDSSSDTTGPATTESKTAPQNTDQPPTPTTPATGGKATVEVVASANIASGTLYIRGGLNGQSGTGKCYANLTGPQGATLRKDTTLLQNASTTDCKTIQIPTSQLTKGTWTYTLNFESDQLQGASSAQTIVVS